jgi:hypothetical protein
MHPTPLFKDMSHIYIYIYIYESRWCNITVVNARTSVEDIIGASKVRFSEELEQVFDQFTVIRTEILI